MNPRAVEEQLAAMVARHRRALRDHGFQFCDDLPDRTAIRVPARPAPSTCENLIGRAVMSSTEDHADQHIGVLPVSGLHHVYKASVRHCTTVPCKTPWRTIMLSLH